jgi:hypothetical protein
MSDDLSGIGDRNQDLVALGIVQIPPPPMSQGALFPKDAVEKPDDLILIPWPV